MDGTHTPDPQAARALRVIAADEDAAALGRTADLLEGLGHQVTACTASIDEACELIARDDPDLAIVVVHRDHDHALGLIDELSEVASGPVVALLAGADADFAQAAAARGVDALASEPTADGLQAAIEVAIQRHAERSTLARTVGQLEHALGRRAIIERAKGILMERHGLSERGSFDLLRGTARSRSTSVVGLAQDVIDGEDIAVDTALS
jgi:AmiR/NasT family two-component response regulator